MILFNPTVPIFRLKKQWIIKDPEQEDLLYIQVKIKNKTLFNTFYTCLDQVFVIWGVICATIFITAQFAPISWVTQAIVWSVSSLVGIVTMMIITHLWVTREGMRWLLDCWVLLMAVGVFLTDGGIFFGWGRVLLHLCDLWLVLSAIGYFITAWGMRSRAFFLAGLSHIGGMLILPWVTGWQFLTTGLIMTMTLFVFAQTQWDDYGC